MHNPEQSITKRPSTAGRIGDLLFKFWHGYSIQEGQQFAYWQSVGELLNIDGKVADTDWMKSRQAELSSLPITDAGFTEQLVKAYGRAHLEDYCRHQGVLEDGRVVTHVPAYGTTRDELAHIGILADNFKRENIHESSDQNFTVILPTGWTMRPDYDPAEGEEFMLDTANCERSAAVFDEANNRTVAIFYNAKPRPFADDFRSFTRVLDTKL